MLVPKRMAQVNGEAAVAWWQIDPATGETLGVGEDGAHQFIVTLPGAIKLFLIAVAIALIAITLCRYILWQRAAEATWAYFFRYWISENQKGNTQQGYMDALYAAKQYMTTISA